MLRQAIQRGVLASAMALLAAGAASASTLNISITNHQGNGGVFLTPLYFAFHNGNFDAFDVGEVASRGLEVLAEEGDFGPVRDERVLATGGAASVSQGGALFGREGFGSVAGQPPVIDPGETATSNVTIQNTATNRFFTYLSMVIPSNDTFIGNEMAREVFDIAGNFVGDQVIRIYNADTWDAGTEVNNGVGAAFAASATNTAPGATELDQEGVVTTEGDLRFLTQFGFTTAAGTAVTNVGNPDALLATITISEVPLPAGAPLILSGLGLLGALRLRSRKAKA